MTTFLSGDAVRRALRTFLITTVGLFIPGLLGWLNDLTSWAQGNGTRPFPDGHGLAYLGVSAVVAGVVAVVNLIWNGIEDAAGKGVLRTPPTTPPPPAGYVAVRAVRVYTLLMTLMFLAYLGLMHYLAG